MKKVILLLKIFAKHPTQIFRVLFDLIFLTLVMPIYIISSYRMGNRYYAGQLMRLEIYKDYFREFFARYEARGPASEADYGEPVDW